jgi:error-prone DNA polymerase
MPIADTLLPAYAELCCQSDLSFLQGASAPEALVERAAQLGYQALALTDECSVAGVVRAWRETQTRSIALIVGSQFRVLTDSGHAWRLVVLAQTQVGYANLCQVITTACARAPKGQYRFDVSELGQLRECLMIVLPPPASDLLAMPDALLSMQRHCAEPWWLGDTVLLHANEPAIRAELAQLAGKHGVARVAVGQVHMARRSDKALQDVMTAIGVGQPVQQCGWALAPNAERHLRTRMRLAQLYAPESLHETTKIAQRCTFKLESLRYTYPTEIVPAGYTENAYLRQQTWLGARERYGADVPQNVLKQLEHELDLISELKYAAYFLTVYDLVQFARQREILCQGRGSAANSAVCYCLGITEVDPQHGNTLFERFISRERNEPPDIDVDFEHQRREEVIQYLYQRYGTDRAALTAVQITYRPRSAIRDVGKALGIDPSLIDQLAKTQAWWEGSPSDIQGIAPDDASVSRQRLEQWMVLARALVGKPRHRSQHPGGFVLSQGPLSHLVPIEPARMINRRVVQWDKDDLDALGLLKVDVLALGMLTVIRRALAWTAWRRGLSSFRLQDVPRHDDPTFEMISRADTVGVFQIESRAQMNMLRRLKPREFYDLVIEVAIVRPGPIQGGMVHPYLRRRQGLEPVTYPSSAVQSVLARTLGVPIFQEQVMKIAMVAAGFSAGQADQLRRAMAAWRRRGGLDVFQQQLIEGLTNNGYTPAFAQAIFKQIEGFGEYGFPESHAASFAWLAYVSAWLKCHEPEAFLAALLNSQPMGFYSPSQLIQDAQRHGVLVLQVDVQHSRWECQLSYGQAAHALAHRPGVRLGLNQIKGLSQDVAQRIVSSRERGGSFASLDDLSQRAQLSSALLTPLANAGALQSLTRHRRDALWQAAVPREPHDLLAAQARETTTPNGLQPATVGQEVQMDYETLGYTLGKHPLALLRGHLHALRYQNADALQSKRHGQLVRACGLVTLRQRPHSAKGVMFITLEDETGYVNVIVQPALVQRHRATLLSAQLLGVVGTWQTDGSTHHLLAGRFVDETHQLALVGQAN